jgi:hypothetical protein
MSEAWDDRKKALEEDYFRRQEKELIEKMRERMAAEQQAAQEATPSLKCPKDDGTLVEVDFEGIKIDLCDHCGGAWLDPGELESLTNKDSGGWLSRLWGSK